jgi:hypothetical protein
MESIMEIKIKKVENGYFIEINGETDGEYFEKEYVFPKFSQVQKFVKENLNNDNRGSN